MSLNESATNSPLSGRYLVRNRGWNAALRVTDAALSSVVRVRAVAAPTKPRRILVAVGGQFGDAVIATSVLPELARAFPNAELGMLLPSWSRAVVEGHPHLRWIHTADHWKINRGGASMRDRWKQYRASASQAVREIGVVGYDVAIDLYAYYPNASWLLWRTCIPMRVGYTSGGCGPLYTSAIDWNPGLGHTAAQHRRLVREVTASIDHGAFTYDLPPLRSDAEERAATLVRGRYVVLHPGTGDQRKAWPIERWRDLTARLLAAGARVVFTGKGEHERSIAESISTGDPRVLSLVDQLDWQTFRAVLSNAELVIGPDSAAVHVSAAAGVPTIAIMAAMSDPEYWRPLGRHVAVLTRSVPCAPCFRKAGCEAMTCVRDISVNEVVAAFERLAGARADLRSVEAGN